MLQGIKIEWRFDEMYSAQLLQDFDQNRDYSFSTQEQKTVKQNAFANLANFNYFCELEIDGVERPVSRVEDFQVDCLGGRIRYQFIIPLFQPIIPRKQKIKLFVYDKSYFCDITYQENTPLVLPQIKGVEISSRFEADKTRAYWGNALIPKAALIELWRQ